MVERAPDRLAVDGEAGQEGSVGEADGRPAKVTTSRSKPAVSEPTQAVNPASKVSGSISMNTRRNVSCEGMPLGSSKNVLSQASLLRPYRTMATIRAESSHIAPTGKALDRSNRALIA